jgi:hypothetical protein
MHRWLGTALVMITLVAIPTAAGIIGSSAPREQPTFHGGRVRAKTQVSSAPLLGYGAPAKT